jgi:hypothetical protein
MLSVWVVPLCIILVLLKLKIIGSDRNRIVKAVSLIPTLKYSNGILALWVADTIA